MLDTNATDLACWEDSKGRRRDHATAKPCYNLLASSLCPATHLLPRFAQNRATITQGPLTSSQSRMWRQHVAPKFSHSKLKPVHKEDSCHVGERWGKLFSLMEPVNSNEPLLQGLNSSEINPKAAKLPATSSKFSETALLLQIVLGEHSLLQSCFWSRSHGSYVCSKFLPCSCPVTFNWKPKMPVSSSGRKSVPFEICRGPKNKTLKELYLSFYTPLWRLLGMEILSTESSGPVLNANKVATHYFWKLTPWTTPARVTIQRTAQYFSEKPSNELINFYLNYLQKQLNRLEKKN